MVFAPALKTTTLCIALILALDGCSVLPVWNPGSAKHEQPALEEPYATLIATRTNEESCEKSRVGFTYIDGNYTSRFEMGLSSVRVLPGSLEVEVTCKGSKRGWYQSGFGKDMGIQCLEFITYRKLVVNAGNGDEIKFSCEGGEAQIVALEPL